MEQLIRAANFTRYHSRDVDKLSQLPRNCRVRATYHPSNLARREIAAASCAARVPSRTLLFPALFPYIYIQSTLPHHHTRLAKPWQVQRHAECVVHRAWQSFSDRAQPTAQPTSPPRPAPPPINTDEAQGSIDKIDARTPNTDIRIRGVGRKERKLLVETTRCVGTAIARVRYDRMENSNRLDYDPRNGQLKF